MGAREPERGSAQAAGSAAADMRKYRRVSFDI
jgi:hypothetical protein